MPLCFILSYGYVVVGDRDRPAKALLFDSWYDRYRGVALMVALSDGCLRLGQQVSLVHAQKSFEVKEIGVMYPEPTPLEAL